MAWLLILGIALIMAILTFIICIKNDYKPYSYGEHLGTSAMIGVGTFLLIAMFSVIICSSCCDDGVFQRRTSYTNLTSQNYYLNEITDKYFVYLDMDKDEVNFIYEAETGVPVLCSIPEEQTKIYTNIQGEPAMVRIATWEHSNWYVRSLLGRDARETTYEIYLPNELRVINSGNP